MVKRNQRELVLVGGGHTHVQVLRRFAMEPPPDTHLTVVVDTPVAVYSGMVPGFVAGQYRREELEIDVLPLARRARARVVLGKALSVDAAARRLTVEGRPPLPYDLLSFDVGSIVAGLGLPGIAEHALATRPIGTFVQRLGDFLRRAREGRRGGGGGLEVVVVGAGAGGVELAFTLNQRLRLGSGAAPRITLVQAEDRVLPGYPQGVKRRVERAAERMGIAILDGRRVTAAEEGRVMLDDGETLPCDALLWVTGAVSQSIFRDSGLPTDERGFVLTRPTLQVDGHDDLLAVGDCATLIEHPKTPKAGVYAVRQGPYLIDNLRALLTGGRLRRYQPQRDFLTLLNLGDGRAIGAKWGLSFEGRWVMNLKDRIDRRFMRRFQVLDAGGQLAREFRRPAMDGGEMLCGGCAAKLGQPVLHRALERLGSLADEEPAPEVILGLAVPDDAAAVRSPRGEVVVSTIDGFRPFLDDPFVVGQVAAVNAVSDLLAKGVAPRHALALVALPQDFDDGDAEETLFQLLAGARAALDPLGARLLGGHTVTAPEMLVGFSVTGYAARPEDLLPLGGLAAGQALVLTKALGTGVILHADMKGLVPGPWLQIALASMLRPNADAAHLARQAGATAATDVTGFGLAGHLGEMLRTSGVAATVDLQALPALRGAVELLGQGQRSTFHPQNARLRRGILAHGEAATHPKFELLFDPQTSGGLLFGVPRAKAAETVERLRDAGDRHAAVIGQAQPARGDGILLEVTVGEAAEDL